MASDRYNISFILEVLDKATRPLQKVGRSIGKLQVPIKKVSASLVKMRDKMQDISSGINIKTMGIAVAGVGAAVFKASMDINKGMANIATLIPGNVKRIQELKKGVQDLSIGVGKSTTDMTDGLYQVISAFGDNSETMEKLKINAKAAAAGLATTTDAINLTSAVTKGYNDTTAKAVQKASDLAFTTVRLGQTTFPELAASIGRVVPLAAKLTVSQEELFAGFATLTGVTGNASEVSTQFAAIMRAMLKPTEEMKKAVNELGFESASLMLKDKGLVETLKSLMVYTKGNEEATAALFGRAEALTSVFALTGAQAGDFAKKLGEMNNITDATNTAFKEQTEGINKLGFQWERLKVKVVVFAQKLGDKLAPLFERLFDAIESSFETFKPLTEPLKNLLDAFESASTGGGVFKKALEGIVWVAGKAANAIAFLISGINALSMAWGDHDSTLKANQKTYDAVLKAAKTLRKQYTQLEEKEGKVIAQQSPLYKQYIKVRSKLEALGKERQKLIDKEADVFGGLEKARKSFYGEMPEIKQKAEFDMKGLEKARKSVSDKVPEIKQKAETKQEVDINLKVSTDDNTTVSVDKVNRKTGKGKTRIKSNVGKTIPAGVGGY